MVGVNCFATRTRKHNRKLFFKNNTGSKKAVFVLPADHDQKRMDQEKQKTKKWRKTLIIYPARKNSEKRHKRENVTISVLNKKGLPGTSAKICVWQSGQTFNTFGTLATFQDVSDVPDVPLHIYIVISQIDSFSF